MNKAKILLVEDDDNLRTALEDNLLDEGYEVVAVNCAEHAKAELNRDIDLIVLDIMLPDMDGYRLCKLWRQQGCEAMIIMLTARSLDEDIIRGFEAGADDYLLKPYRLREFLLRVKALLKRSGRITSAQNSLPGFNIDLDARRVQREQGDEVSLTRKEFDLLVFLLENCQRALTRDEILDQVWGREVYVDERTVDNFVSNIKKKLGWHQRSPFRIATIRGVGYRLEIDDANGNEMAQP